MVLQEVLNNKKHKKIITQNGVIDVNTEDVIHLYRGIVLSLAKKYSKIDNQNSLEDYIQDGYIGLIKAYNDYDITREVYFSTFAYKYILTQLNHSYRRNMRHFNHVYLYDTVSAKNNDDNIELIECLTDEHDFTEDIINLESYKYLLDKLLSVKMSKREQEVIESYIRNNFSQTSTANELNVSKQYVSCVVLKIFRRFKRGEFSNKKLS